MKCRNCGRELKNGARFCIGCGAQHDANGQLINANQNKVDYDKTMMSSYNPQQNSGTVDYNKTMMVGSTGFKQYQAPQQNQQFKQQFSSLNNNLKNKNSNKKEADKVKKKISPILIICPLLIIVALVSVVLSGKGKKKTNNIPQNNIPSTQGTIVATDSNTLKDEYVHLKGYWSADADYFFIDGEMQKNKWVGDYYVGDDGKKVVSKWIDNKYYVDATGKKVKNEWIEFTFYGEDGQKKNGYYYVDSDGIKVTNTTIDGRYVNDAGCYWPSYGEDLKNTERKVNNTIVEEAVLEKEKKTETTTMEQTTITSTTIASTTINQITTQVLETTTNMIIPTEKSVETVSSNGTTIAYVTSTEAFPEEKITKYVSIAINDANHQNLANGVAEWNNNRVRTGLASGETIIDNNISITYDITVERNDNKIFSLYETKTYYDNNKAYKKEKKCCTWDSNSGQILSIDAIFNGDEKYQEFAKKVQNKLKSYKSSIDEDTYNEIMEEEPDELFNECNWYMSNSGIVLLFDTTLTNTNKIDGISFTLSYSDSGNNVNKLLLAKYRK